jgi:hypothetical protein
MTPATPRIFSLATARNGAAFLLALAAVCAAINARLPSLRVLGISDKLDYLAAHRGEIDTVFLGSSRVYHAFDPALFDRETGTTHSFNFGIDGMRPPESFYVLREVLKLRLPLRRVFIELAEVQSKVNAANIGSARYVHWHDFQHTALVLRQIAGSTASGAEKWSQAWVHAACFGSRLSNIGRGPEWVDAKLRGPQKTWRIELPWQASAGFEAQTSPALSGAARASYEAAVVQLQSVPMAERPVPPLLGAAWSETVNEVRAAGAQAVLVISPTVVARENLTGLAAAGIDAPVIAFTDPRRHPAIFNAENHCDEQHLNARGAAEFTRALAEESATLR